MPPTQRVRKDIRAVDCRCLRSAPGNMLVGPDRKRIASVYVFKTPQHDGDSETDRSAAGNEHLCIPHGFPKDRRMQDPDVASPIRATLAAIQSRQVSAIRRLSA